MDVHLLVYDLSRGVARQMSAGLLGFQLDAVYHTSIEVDGREYVYDGGIVVIAPGSSHLGQPMERLLLGTTEVPTPLLLEYLDSVRPIFTADAYDLFHHNCNNFSDALSNFLVGHGIPEHILHMPQAVLASPMGAMLLPQLAQAVQTNRQRTGGSLLGLAGPGAGQMAADPPPFTPQFAVKNVSTPAALDRLLAAARSSCAVIFFTSATCAPCKALYPLYDGLAQELGGRALLCKVDLALPQATALAAQYGVRATPTFVTFLHGERENQWTGADVATLQGNLRLLVAMAQTAHPHAALHLPTLAGPDPRPVLFSKVPPLDKLLAKMGGDAAADDTVQALRRFLEARATEAPADAVLPPLGALAAYVRHAAATLPPTALFAVVDLFRCSLTDVRVSGYFAEEANHATVCAALRLVVGDSSGNSPACPYALHLVTLQMACNLFSTPLYGETVCADEALRALLVALVTASFLDHSHTAVRVAAAALLYNMAVADRRARERNATSATEAKTLPTLPPADQVALAAAVMEAIADETTSAEALHGMLAALGHLVYLTPLDGELADLLRSLDAAATIVGKQKAFPSEGLLAEIGGELLGKGLRK